jgi:precorrin-6A/cobalt-precorrin-6A reductase
VILLLGGTSEAVPIARTLAAQGYAVWLSTATDLILRDALPFGVRRRSGRLDKRQMCALIRTHAIRMVVDATHPYARAVSSNARIACQTAGVPYLRYERPPGDIGEGSGDILRAADHPEAAVLACRTATPILLTIGSRHAGIYIAAARAKKIPVWARVLDQSASIAACREAGLDPGHIIAGQGPFSEKQNSDLIRRHHIGVLVTKESGAAGGLEAKIAAARRTGARVILVERPPPDPNAFHCIPELLLEIEALH